MANVLHSVMSPELIGEKQTLVLPRSLHGSVTWTYPFPPRRWEKRAFVRCSAQACRLC